MSATLTSTGLTIDTFNDLLDQFDEAMRNLYGQDIVLTSDTQDGQMVTNYVQQVIDNEEAILQVFNSFTPDNAIGTVLDQRVAINGIQREMGTYTTTNVKLTIDSTTTLYGLDQESNQVFTVTDAAGSAQWFLEETVTLVAGTYEKSFRASITGPVVTIPGTITVPVTVEIGVSDIINDQAYLSLGTAEETDAQLKIRRQQSTAIGSQGYYSGLVAQLQNISGIGVGNVKVYENYSSATSTGTVPAGLPADIPAHSIWVVVGGGTASESQIGGTAGANAPDIAQAIYSKRNAGCGMYVTTDSYGQSYAITQDDGSLFGIYWNTVEEVPVFINFTVGSINGTNYPNIQAIVNGTTGLPGTFLPGINETVNVNTLVNKVQAIDPNTFVSASGFSLSTSGFTSTLTPAAGNNQFQFSSANIIITPAIMYSPTSVISITTGIPVAFTVTETTSASGGSITFAVWGGYSDAGYTYSIPVNNSGATFVAGVYTPGASPGTDTIRATDTLGNVANVTVVVA